MAFGTYSVTMPVEVVAEGGMLVRQVDVDGAALDDSTDVYSLAIPVTLVDATGTTENGAAGFGVWLKITESPNGVAVVRCDDTGTAISTPFDTPIGTSNLSALTLPSYTLPEDAVSNHSIGYISGNTAGSTLTLVDDEGGRIGIQEYSEDNWLLYLVTGETLDFETEPSLQVTVRETLGGYANSPNDSNITINVSDVTEDVTAPTLSSASGSATGPNGANISVTTNEANGTLYWVVTTSSTAPSAAQVKAGLNNGGTTAVDSGSQTIFSTGAKPFTADGLTAATVYYAHFMHEDAAGNQSTVASSASFTTDSVAVPSNTVGPVISGTPAQTMTLTVTNGIWSGSPSSYTYAWYSNATSSTTGGSLIVGETGNTLDVDSGLLGLYIYATVSATNVNGTSSPANSNVVGPVLEQPLPSTNATLTSAAGADPEVDIENVTAGWTLHIQRDETGGDYSTPTLDITHLITEHEETTGAIPNANLAGDGYSSPSGAGIQRYRYETDDGRFGPWSEISYNVSASVNVFPTADGTSRSQYINGSTTPRLDFFLESNLGSVALIRGLTECPDKFHFEVRIDGFYSGADDAVYAGIADSATVTSLATFLGTRPGEGSVPGCLARVSEGGTQIGVSANGTSTTHSIGATIAVGDYFIFEGNRTAGTVAIYVWDSSAAGGAGALANGGSPIVTKTLTSNIPADWHAVCGGRRGTGTVATSDSGTANFGASAFVMTPNTGFNGW